MFKFRAPFAGSTRELGGKGWSLGWLSGFCTWGALGFRVYRVWVCGDSGSSLGMWRRV